MIELQNSSITRLLNDEYDAVTIGLILTVQEIPGLVAIFSAVSLFSLFYRENVN